MQGGVMPGCLNAVSCVTELSRVFLGTFDQNFSNRHLCADCSCEGAWLGADPAQTDAANVFLMFLQHKGSGHHADAEGAHGLIVMSAHADGATQWE